MNEPGSGSGGASQARSSQQPQMASGRPGKTPAEEKLLIEGLRRRDESAFMAVVEQYHASLIRMATLYVPSRDVAEEVVQETWLAVLEGIERFEERSSLKTWIFQILINRAKTRGQREARSVPFSALADASREADEAAVEPERFLPANHPQWPGHWAVPPTSWGANAEERLLAAEARHYLHQAIEGLPANQRQVITLRDIEGWSSEEVCNVLGLSETNQRVILHRARSRVRRELENYFGRAQR